jgi:DNA-binding response OmpR family regulator
LDGSEPSRSQLAIDNPVISEIAQPSRETILVIDDDPAVGDLMFRSLTKLGFRVLVGASGAEGLRLAKAVHPMLITLDVVMPEVDGWTVLRQLRADPELAKVPVIMVTVVDDEPMGADLGASSYMIKPVDRERLAVLVEQYAGSASREECSSPHSRAIRG